LLLKLQIGIAFFLLKKKNKTENKHENMKT